MNLPAHPHGGVQIGISDILQWRDCAARMQFGMRRHEQGAPPETWSPANAYGSAIHLCLELLDNGALPEEAVQEALRQFKQWLEPSDVSRLYEDIAKYEAREMLGVRTILNEGEISFRLFEHPTAGQVWFRARIDRLYQSIEDPSLFIHVDYKSSKWAKSMEDVTSDLQIWSYNLALFEFIADEYPELETVRLQQVYDQLNYGQLDVPQKGLASREEIRRWLISAVTALIEDEAMEPTFNEWCPWCPLKMDCPVVQHELTDWALTRIAALMPREERLNKDGSVSKRPGPVQLDAERMGDYVELLPDIKRARGVLEAFEDEVGDVLKKMPEIDLEELGKRKQSRSRRTFTTEAKRQIVDRMGLGRALILFDLSLAAVERFFGDDKDAAAEIVSLAETQRSYDVITDAR